METNSRRAVVAVLAIITGAVVVAPVLEGQQAAGDGVLDPSEAFNCSLSASCSVVTVERRPDRCVDTYVMGWHQEQCTWTTQGTDQVSLIAAPNTYIDLPYRPFDATIGYRRTPGVRRVGDIEALSDGRILMSGEKSGRLLVFNETGVRTVDSVDVVSPGTNGLLGIAVDPDFEQNRWIYLLYTAQERGNVSGGSVQKSWFWQRVSRFRLTDDGLRNETVILDGLPASTYHSGGGLEVGPEGLLYVTVGDAYRGPYAQDVDRLNGKILRIRRDGGVPASNPFEGSPVYSYGHRNPQTLTWGPDGTLYAAEHGNIRHDEINRIEPGHNYGWPAYRCDRPTTEEFVEIRGRQSGVDYNVTVDSYTRPYRCYQDWTLAPGAVMAITNRSDPAYGTMLVAGLWSKHLGRFRIGDDGPQDYRIRFVNHRSDRNPLSQRIRALEYVDGRIYAAGDLGGLAVIDRRLTP